MKGARRMVRRLGYNWDTVRISGVPISEIENVDDFTVQQVIKYVRAKNGQ